MKRPGSAGGVGTAALRAVVIAAVLMLAAGTSYADRDGGRGGREGARVRQGGGERTYRDGGSRVRSGGGDRVRGGGDRTYGSGVRRYKGGGPDYGGAYRGGGGSAYRGGSGYGGGYSRGGHGGGNYYRGGGRSYRGGYAYDCAPYYGSRVRYVRPYRHVYVRPRSYVSFGLGLGLPYYCPPTYRYHVVPRPVVEEYSSAIDVENLPPAGCYYYDRACGQRFADLDSYTEHIDAEGHSNTIEIIDEDTGDLVRTLEFVGGYWEVQR